MATQNGSSNTQIVSAADYIQNLDDRVNEVSASIQQYQAQETTLSDQQQILQDQLNRVTTVLTYIKKVNPQIEDLWQSVTSLLNFYDVRRPKDLSISQTDLKPADDTLQAVATMVTEIGARLYFAIVNVNVCAKAAEETYQKLIKNTNLDPDPDSSSNSFGRVSVSIPPQDDLVSKMKNAKDAGIAAMEALANTFLGYINYLQSIEELRGLAQYLTLGFQEEIKALDMLEARIENRERIADREKKLFDKDYKQVTGELDRVTAYLTQLKMDYNLLRAELAAALASSKLVPS